MNILPTTPKKRKSGRKYKFYNLEKGEIECTVKELQQQYIKEISMVTIYALVKGKLLGIGEGNNRWVLTENKDFAIGLLVNKGGRPPKKHRFYNPEVGEVECTIKELWEQYIEKDKYSFNSVEELARGSRLVLGDSHWMLAKNKSLYKEGRCYKEDVIRLTHPDIGTKEFTRKKFLQEIGGTRQGISLLLMGKLKSYKGWSVLT
jgi:hypothetical protein